jgi:hypothetical protein
MEIRYRNGQRVGQPSGSEVNKSQGYNNPSLSPSAQNAVNKHFNPHSNQRVQKWEVKVGNKTVTFTSFYNIIYMGQKDAQSTATFLGFPLRNQIAVNWTVDYEVSTDLTLSIDVAGPDGQGYGTGDSAHFASIPLGKHFMLPDINLKPNQHFAARKLVNIEGIGYRYLYGHLEWDSLGPQPVCKLDDIGRQLRKIFNDAGKPL